MLTPYSNYSPGCLRLFDSAGPGGASSTGDRSQPLVLDFSVGTNGHVLLTSIGVKFDSPRFRSEILTAEWLNSK